MDDGLGDWFCQHRGDTASKQAWSTLSLLKSAFHPSDSALDPIALDLLQAESLLAHEYVMEDYYCGFMQRHLIQFWSVTNN